MKIVLFCEQKYAINILQPLEVEANKKGGHSVIWYVQPKNISDFPLKDEVKWTNNIQEIYDFSPDAIFVPCNIVPYYLPGVKIQIFHGYAAEKKDHWVIRRYFDTYTRILKLLKQDGLVKTGFTKIYTLLTPKKTPCSENTIKTN